jgi:hypothetical protein
MRESQMKKIIAAAVATAFVAPAFAADISITGDQAVMYVNGDSSTTMVTNGDFNVKASAETANGWSVSADLNIGCGAGCGSSSVTANNIYSEGGNSLTIKGPMGTLDLGDASGAVDALDDTTDWGYYATSGSGGNDASILWTLPSFADGLTINVSHTADSNSIDSATASDGWSFKYSAEGATVGYGANEYQAGEEEKIVIASYAAAGGKVAYEQHTDTTAAGVDTDTTSLGVTYTTGDITIAYEGQTIESAGSTSNDTTAIGIHYSMGGGVTSFVETLSDSKDATADATVVGIHLAF